MTYQPDLRLAAELGRCQVERDTYKRIAEKIHDLHKDIMGALPFFEGVYEALIEEHPQLADTQHEGMQRLRGEHPKPAAINERMVG